MTDVSTMETVTHYPRDWSDRGKHPRTKATDFIVGNIPAGAADPDHSGRTVVIEVSTGFNAKGWQRPAQFRTHVHTAYVTMAEPGTFSSRLYEDMLDAPVIAAVDAERFSAKGLEAAHAAALQSFAALAAAGEPTIAGKIRLAIRQVAATV